MDCFINNTAKLAEREREAGVGGGVNPKSCWKIGRRLVPSRDTVLDH